MFLAVYVGWQLVQFFLPLLFIGLIFPENWVGVIWVGQDRELVLLSFAAVFMQQQGWYAMIQIGESTRSTDRVQIMNVSIALAHLLIICTLWIVDLLSLKLLFTIIIFEYLVAISVAYKVLKIYDVTVVDGTCTATALYSNGTKVPVTLFGETIDGEFFVRIQPNY